MDTLQSRSSAASLVAQAIATITAKANRRRVALSLAAVVLAGAAYSYSQGGAKPRNTTKGSKNKPGAAQGPRKRSPQAALHSLIAYLLPLAGRKVMVLVALAVLRTALSNRLARLQVYVLLYNTTQ